MKTGCRRREALGLGVLLAAYFVLGGLYLATAPFGHAPDEGAHLAHVQQLARGRLPVLDSHDSANFEAHQPPLAYVLALPVYLAAGGNADDPSVAAEYAVRIVDLLLGALVVVLVYAGVRVWLPGTPATAWGAAAVTAFLPMRLAVASSFSNDPLTEVIFCSVLLLLALGLRDGITRRRSLLVGVLIGLGLLTKTTCVLLLPLAWVALFLAWRRRRSEGGAVNALLLTGAALLIGGPWLARNVGLYGDPFAMNAFLDFFGDRSTPQYFMTHQGMTAGQYWMQMVLGFTSRSFWGVFDHMNLWMGGPATAMPGIPVLPDQLWRGGPEAPIYTSLERLACLLAVGAVIAGVRWKRGGPEGWQKDVALCWGLCVLMVLAAFVRFNLTYFQAQARYLYPAILPIAAAMAMGWLAPWPERRRNLGAALLGVALAALALTTWHGTLLRYFGRVGW